MPIGKNAIKRVVNNGYSNVKTAAPDMENSTVAEEKKAAPKKTPAKNPVPKAVTSNKKTTPASRTNPAPKAATVIEPVEKKPAAKKPAAKKPAATEPKVKAPEVVKEEVKVTPAPKKSMETEPELAPVRTLEKITEKSERNGEGYINFGGELPVYLL